MDWEDAILQKQELRDELLEYCDGECDQCPLLSGYPLTEDGLKRNSSRKMVGSAH